MRLLHTQSMRRDDDSKKTKFVQRYRVLLPQGLILSNE
jgi:hypothetical protein